MRKNVLLIMMFLLIFNLGVASCEISPSPVNQQNESFYVQHTFWAFAGIYPVYSFNANSGDQIELNISSVNADPDRPDDVYVVDLEIASGSHGTSFISGTGFTQIITLNYTDTYNITADKHQFFSSVTISGTITVYHQPKSQTTNTPLPTSTPTIKATMSPLPNTSTNSSYSPSTTPSIPEFQAIAILLLLASMLCVAFTLRKRKQLS
jgi:hypothetical protein